MKKEGIDYVFEQNPNLVRIGSKEQYEKYLETVFPKSKVRDIVYHGTNEDFISKGEFFDKEKIGKSFEGDKGFFGKGFYFTGISKYKNNHGKIVYPAMIDAKNPLILNNPTIQKIKDLNGKKLSNDSSIIYNDYKPSEEKILFGKKILFPEVLAGNSEIMVAEPSQIHILGSQKDIQGFKKFVEQNGGEKDSLEKRVISGFFIASFLFGLIISLPKITGNIIGISQSTFSFQGVILLIVGMVGFLFNNKYKK